MRVEVLGQLSVTDDGGADLRAQELPRRARQVLGVLAARYDRIQTKDALADAVWGEQLPGNHVAALEHYVSVIRRRLQPAGSAATWFIVTRSGGYVFDTGRAGLDLADLRVRIRRLDGLPPDDPQRLELQQGILDLARELPFGEDPYADWAEPVRNEVQVAAVNALLQLAGSALPRDPARALRLALEAVELNPYLEPGYRAAMDAAVALGRPDDALRLYERCRRALDEELGVAPSAPLVRLHRAILAGRHAPAADRPEPAAAPPAAAPPAPLRLVRAPAPAPAAAPPGGFLGRGPLLDLLLGDPGPVTHVVGPAGSGKTALLAELARRAPGRVGVGHGASSVGPLRLAWLGAVLRGLGVDPRIVEPADTAAADPAVAAATGGAALGRERLEAVAAALAGPGPLLLAVDDAAGLDAVSVAELAWLSRHCPALRVVLTYRYPSQLAGRPVAELGSPVVLRLGPLTAGELAGRDAAVPDATGGIPALVAVADRPAEIGRAVAMQIARQRTQWMPEPAWEVLRLCAALGSLRTTDLAVLTGHPVEAVLGCVDALVHAHLLAEGPGGHVRHRSGLISDAVAEQVSSASSMHLRERLAAATA